MPETAKFPLSYMSEAQNVDAGKANIQQKYPVIKRRKDIK